MLKPLESLSHRIFVSVKCIHSVISILQDHRLTHVDFHFKFLFNAADVCLDTVDLGKKVVYSVVTSHMVIPNNHTGPNDGKCTANQMTRWLRRSVLTDDIPLAMITEGTGCA